MPMTAVPSPTTCSTSRRPTSRGSTSARTSSWCRSARCEQHGAHLPLGTDTITALEVSRRAAEKAEVPYAPPFWAGYSPQHLREPESGVGTITLRADTLNEVLYDIARSLIHHGWNKLIFVNGHGSNTKVIDPLLRRIKYETGAFVALYKPYAERYIGLLDGLLENPPEETPGWHASELETSQVMAHNAALVQMERAARGPRAGAAWLPDSFIKKDGAPDVEFDGYQYFVFPMDHGEFSRTGVIGNPMRGHRREGRGGAEPLRGPPRQGHRRVPPARRHVTPAGVRGPRLTTVPPALRRAQILERIQRDGGVSVADLARDHAVSPITVHRDLEQLAREGLVERVHGGARSIRRRSGALPLIADRVDAAGRAGARGARRRSPTTRRRSSRRARRSSSTRLDVAGARPAADGGPAERAHAGHELARRSPTRCSAEPMHVVVCPGRARPAHADARRPLDGRVPRRAELRRRVRLRRRASRLDAGLTTSRRPLADVVNAARAARSAPSG